MTGDVQLNGITINAAILEGLQGINIRRNVLKGVTFGLGTGSQIMQLKLVNRNHEPIEGATCSVLNAIGESNNVLSFDGVDDYVNCGNNSALALTSQITVECLVKSPDFTNADSHCAFMAKWNPGGYLLWAHNTGDSLRWGNGTSSRVQVNNAKSLIEDNQWHHIAGVRDATQMRLFVDAVQIGSNTNGTMAANTVNFTIGAYNNGGAGRYTGQIAEVRVWNYGKSQAEIQAQKDIRLVGNEAGLVEYWKLDEGTGSLVNGLVGSNNGTIFGATWQEAGEDFPLYDNSIQGYDPTPYDSQTTNANGLTTLNYQINTIHGLEVTLPGKRRFIMPFKRTTRGLLDWQVMLSDYLATFATDRGNILINSEPENNDSNFLIE